jgi:hypothetical protein
MIRNSAFVFSEIPHDGHRVAMRMGLFACARYSKDAFYSAIPLFQTFKRMHVAKSTCEIVNVFEQGRA